MTKNKSHVPQIYEHEELENNYINYPSYYFTLWQQCRIWLHLVTGAKYEVYCEFCSVILNEAPGIDTEKNKN